jgi:hypothetical protein
MQLTQVVMDEPRFSLGLFTDHTRSKCLWILTDDTRSKFKVGSMPFCSCLTVNSWVVEDTPQNTETMDRTPLIGLFYRGVGTSVPRHGLETWRSGLLITGRRQVRSD